jgi:poly(ADP-ribose) glycohydrolase ARH3
MTLGDIELKDRFRGCMLGLALGDALGAPFEGWNGGEVSFEHIPPILRYTDDTEMAIGIAESLSRQGGFDAFDMSERFVRNFDPSRGYGPGTIAVLGMIRNGISFEDANSKVFPDGSYGNGAAMRSAPLGLFYSLEDPGLKNAAYGSSSITHSHPLAKERAYMISYAVSQIVNGRAGHELLDGLFSVTGHDEYRAKLNILKSLLEQEPSAEEVVNSLGNSVLAVESAPTAIYAFLRYGEDYLKTVRFCISLGGDTDTISAMAGALSGAQVGIRGLPMNLLGRLESRERIEKLSLELFRSHESVSGKGDGG